MDSGPQRALALALLLLTLPLLAGCLSPAAMEELANALDPRQHAAEAAQAGIPIALGECVVVEAIATVPAGKVRPHVPEDFDLVATPAGVPVALGGAVCAEGPLDAPASFGLLAVMVSPRHAHLENESVSRYFWKTDLDLPPSGLAALVAAIGGHFTPVGEVSVERSALATTFRVHGFEWAHTVTVAAAPAVPGSGRALEMDGRFREYSAATLGYAFLDAEFRPRSGASVWAGPATVTPGEGTLARELFGAQATLPAVVYARVDYRDAVLGLVPSPSG